MAYVYQEYPKVLYHPTLAPQGRTFNSADDAKGFTPRKGWVDTAAKFPKPSRARAAVKAWWADWDWAVKAAAALVALAAAIVALIKALVH
jgi:hypothetical protein